MGEYAKRISDGVEIKIGTCEDMLYLRFEDRDKVSALEGSVDVNDPREAGQLRFRLPFPDEDDVLPGEYKDPFRGQRLYNSQGDEFKRESLIEHPGLMQVHHRQSGLLLNIPCYHGIKLPEVGPNAKAFWNGKSWFFELSFLRAVYEDGKLQIHPVIKCRHCGESWRIPWSEVIGYIPEPLYSRLGHYAKEGMERELAALKKGAA